MPTDALSSCSWHSSASQLNSLYFPEASPDHTTVSSSRILSLHLFVVVVVLHGSLNFVIVVPYHYEPFLLYL